MYCKKYNAVLGSYNDKKSTNLVCSNLSDFTILDILLFANEFFQIG